MTTYVRGVRLVVTAGAVALALAGCGGTDEVAVTSPPPTTSHEVEGGALAGVQFDIRRDPGWGCCSGWVVYLQDHHADIELVDDSDRATYRAEIGVPEEAASCHTAIVEGYALEGHIPVGAIVRLLEDRPDAVGLALPGMPADSPGMGGDVTTWERQPVMLIGRDGTLVPFDY